MAALAPAVAPMPLNLTGLEIAPVLITFTTLAISPGLLSLSVQMQRHSRQFLEHAESLQHNQQAYLPEQFQHHTHLHLVKQMTNSLRHLRRSTMNSTRVQARLGITMSFRA
jgi:hypothetical protein